MNLYVILLGNVVEGVTPIGPFRSRQAAGEYAKDAEWVQLGVTFHITNLKEPS